MKTKIILLLSLLFLFRLFFSVEISHAVTVKDLYPASKVYNATSKSWSVPAVIQAIGANGVARESVLLGITKSIGGGLLTSLAIGGAAYIANSYVDWLMAEDPPMYYDQDGILKYNTYTETIVYPAGIDDAFNAYVLANLPNVCSGNGTKVLDGFDLHSEDHAGYETQAASGGWTYQGCTCQYKRWTHQVGTSCPNITLHSYATCPLPSTCGTPSSVTTKNPVTPEYLNPKNEAALTADNGTVKNGVDGAIDKGAALISGGACATAGAGTLIKKICDAFAAGVDATDATNLDTKAGTKTAAEVAADETVSNKDTLTQEQLVSALKSLGLTAAEIAEATGKAVGANVIIPENTATNTHSITQDEVETAVGSVVDGLIDAPAGDLPIDPEILMPTKLSLTTIIGAFMTQLNALPMMNTLHGLTIQCSGTSSLCLNLPAGLGGNKCYDASGMTGALNTIGSALLGLTTVFSFVGIFKS